MCTLFFIVSLSLVYFISSEAKAEPKEKKDVLSEYLFSSAGLPGTGPRESGDYQGKSRQMSIHLNKGLDAFLDLGQPEHKGFRTKDNDWDYRAIFGLHIPLQ